jgi:hypothetical protein
MTTSRDRIKIRKREWDTTSMWRYYDKSNGLVNEWGVIRLSEERLEAVVRSRNASNLGLF